MDPQESRVVPPGKPTPEPATPQPARSSSTPVGTPAGTPAGTLAGPQPPDRAALAERCVVEFVRGSGPGGQHRNKRYTGVRLTDPVTGTVVSATERRSQIRNLNIALDRMAVRLADLAHVPRPRKATRPSRGAKRRRLQAKRRRGETKALRKRPEDH